MAKIKYSALVSDMRNKLNGSVLSKNRYGSYVRNKVTPVNPQTSFQQAVRQRLGTLSAGWRALSQGFRDGWTEVAKSAPFTDIFGDTKHLDGKAFYVKLNSNLLGIGLAPISAPPALGSLPEVAIDGISADTAGSIIVTLGTGALPAGYSLKVYATPPMAPQINFVKNQFRELAGAQATTGGAVELDTVYADRFNAITSADAGKRIFIRAVVIDDATGQSGVPVEGIAVIA